MKHRIVTAAQMKEIERAGDAHGLPYLQMMENAGLAAYAELQKQFPHPGRVGADVHRHLRAFQRHPVQSDLP